MHKIFIDGRAGTTGLRIEQRLNNRRDIELLRLPEDQLFNTHARAEMLNTADVSFLCLPDDAAREAAALTTNPASVIIDASTAHRTQPSWAYGIPELGAAFRTAIQTGKRIAGPGCHSSGFIALVKPLVDSGLLQKDAQLSCLSLTGYTGGGLAAIAKYEDPSRTRGDDLSAPMQYALEQQHKHLPEMTTFTGLTHAPVFCPIIADYDCGMEVTVPLHGKSRFAVLACYQEFYANAAMIRASEGLGSRPASHMRGRDSMEITVEGHDDRLLLVARFDNLGKGACGAAIQCMNLAIGADESEGLVV